MQDRIRFSHTVRFVPSDDLESHVKIEAECFFILFVYVHLIQLLFPSSVFQ